MTALLSILNRTLRFLPRILPWIVCLALILLPAFSLAAAESGLVITLRGKARILREAGTLEARLKGTVLDRDILRTLEKSKLKVLFQDDGILTLGPETTLAVQEFLESKEGAPGRSVFRLMDGKIRTLTGKNRFEVHTPTAVAAARGTGLIVWVEQVSGRAVTGIAVLEGTVSLRNIDPGVTGEVTLLPGQVSRVPEGIPPAPPAVIPPKILQEAREATELEMEPEAAKPEPESVPIPAPPAVTEAGTAQAPPPTERETPREIVREFQEEPLPITPPIEQQPNPTTPATLEVVFP